ncbi:MAG: NAD(P) transhydrogenase subunit alpha [Desulfobacterales bacterium]|jgi:NAD(P) transhydrogenase subunit alpha
MNIGIPREVRRSETRIAITPETADRFVKLGLSVTIERGVGEALIWPDATYESVGATVAERSEVLSGGDILLRVGLPALEDIPLMKSGVIHVGFLDPFGQKEIVAALAAQGVRAVSMEMMPRSTVAQKMDALSSQHSLAGYYMVILAAERLGKTLPMMMTPSGTIQPARVFVIGAGVAGLQAIATAKRLGARVEAFDTRPVVSEQVESLGAKFLHIDLGETGQTDQGYALELTPEQQHRQHQGMSEACVRADIVITTAQLFGRPAPRVVTADMLDAMKPGAVVVDYAVESGGNVEGSISGKEIDIHGVRVIGLENYPGRVALDASRMYANNLYYFIETIWDKESRGIKTAADDGCLAGALVTDGGKIVNEQVLKHYRTG